MSGQLLFGPDRDELTPRQLWVTPNTYLVVGEVICVALVIIGVIAAAHGGVVIAAPLAYVFLGGGSVGTVLLGGVIYHRLQNSKHPKQAIFLQNKISHYLPFLQAGEYLIYNDSGREHYHLARSSDGTIFTKAVVAGANLSRFTYVQPNELTRREKANACSPILDQFANIAEALIYQEGLQEHEYVQIEDGTTLSRDSVHIANMQLFTDKIQISARELRSRISSEEDDEDAWDSYQDTTPEPLSC